jgi:DnaD/phage-associated family protein
MKQFSGFPARTQFTAIPNVFFSNLLPEIDDLAELKLTLYLFWSLYGKKGYPRFVTYRELTGRRSLVRNLGGEGKPPEEALSEALKRAVKRGVILHIVVDRNGTPEDVYFLNTEAERKLVAKIRNGEFVLAGWKAGGEIQETGAGPLPDIFTLYEENIGLLTPLVAEELQEAEKAYPEAWIREAIKEAADLNKRSWRYIARILERWAAEGRSDGAHRRDFTKADAGKYDKQKYGDIIKR